MKRPLLYLALILTGVLFAAETDKAQPADPLVLAKQAVDKHVAQPLTRHDRPMSRIGPIAPVVEYGELVEVEGEKRLPFTIRQRRGLTLTGYVRLSDRAILLMNQETLQHTPLQQHPAFRQGDGKRIRL